MFTTQTFYDEDLQVITAYVSVYDEFHDDFHAVGSSKCMEEDEFDYELGEQLAISRALTKLGKLMHKEAFREVHKRDEVRKNAKLAAAAAKGRQQLAKYRWECEFAELINLQLENDVVPEPVKKGKDKKSKKPRGKAFQIRQDLPA